MVRAMVGAFRVPIMLAAMLSGKVLKKRARPRQQDCPIAHCGRAYPERVASAKPAYPKVTEEVASCEPQEQ
jgi:hypothetical protein